MAETFNPMAPEDELIELVDEDGETKTYEWLATFTMNDAQYIAVADATEEEDPESIEVLFLRIEQDEDGNDVYVSVNDEKEADDAFAAFMDLVDEEEEEDGEYDGENAEGEEEYLEDEDDDFAKKIGVVLS